MRILAIHGVGHADAKTDWQPRWTEAIRRGLEPWGLAAAPDVRFLAYDDLFEARPLDAARVGEALLRLTASGLFWGLADWFRPRGGVAGLPDSVRWTAGMVAQWVADETLRSRLRQHLAAQMRAASPDLVLAHSLGSLIAYDTFRRDEVAQAARPGASLLAGRTLLTFGSQIGNPTVRSVFGGRIEPLHAARFWWNLFNVHDDVFTTPLRLPAPARYLQVATPFDLAGGADHDGAAYLAHADADVVWQDVATTVARAAPGAAQDAPAPRPPAVAPAAVTAPAAGPQRRALLVGVADYPDPAAALGGPVNDVFAVSAALQELGFAADSIRVVLNDRATADGIRERLDWLVDGASPDDELFFFFAGHGAQLPGYGRDAEVDHIDECLVPFDFDWSAQRAITDDEFARFYAQLPYGCRFTAMLDCCHAGGMSRASGRVARGLAPPDDIRHRMLRWERDTQMWVPRRRLEHNPAADRALRDPADKASWLGRSGSLRRLGRGASLWAPTDAAFERASQAQGHLGAYAPVILEACQEGELAYEYRHGVISYGAFTHSLCGVLREAARRPAGRPALTFEQLVAQTAQRMAHVVPERQTPQLHCPDVWRGYAIPGL